jgi:protein TonB
MTQTIPLSILSRKVARKLAASPAAIGWTRRCLGIALGSMLSMVALAGPAHDKLPMTGIADLWQLRQEVYIGALYLPAAAKTPEDVLNMAGPKRMELRVTANKLSTRQWGELWNQAININNAGKDELKGLTDDVIAFTGLLKDSLTNGDRITIDYTPKAVVDIAIDGTVLYKSRNDRFFNALVKAWVGPRPPSSDFKRNIVTLPTDAETKDLIDRYSVVLPEDSRKTEIAAWVKGAEPPKVAEKPKPVAPPPAAKPEPKPEPKVVAVPVPAPAPKLVVPPPAPTPTPAPPVAVTKPAPATPAPAAPAPQPKPAEVAKAPTPAPAAPAAAPAQTAASDDAARLDGIRNIYRANMLRLTYRHVIYPASALSKNQEGTVIMRVSVNRAGKVLGIANEKLSEFVALNKAAEKAVKKASPFPEVPAQLPGDKFEFSIPIKFRIPT